MCQRVKENESRVHGMQLPLHPYQILVWSTIIISIIVYVTIVVPYHPGDLHLWIPSGIYGGLWIIGFSNFLWVSLTDPKTKRVKGATTTEMTKIEGDHAAPLKENREDNQPDLVECTKCSAMKLPDTKHCNLCHKCVDDFDHHCVYLNTCIGGPNYWNFFTLITCLTLFLVAQLYVTIHWAVEFYLNNGDYIYAVDKSLIGGHSHILLGIITASIPFCGLMLISSLEFFHIFIIILRTTTYKWIIERRRQRADALYKAEQRKAEKLKKRAAKAAKKQKTNGKIEPRSTDMLSSDDTEAIARDWHAKQTRDLDDPLKKETTTKRKLLEDKGDDSVITTVDSELATRTHSTQPSQSLSRLTQREGEQSVQDDGDLDGDSLLDGARRSTFRPPPSPATRVSISIIRPPKKQPTESLLRIEEDNVERRLSFLGVANLGDALADKSDSAVQREGIGDKDRGKYEGAPDSPEFGLPGSLLDSHDTVSESTTETYLTTVGSASKGLGINVSPTTTARKQQHTSSPTTQQQQLQQQIAERESLISKRTPSRIVTIHRSPGRSSLSSTPPFPVTQTFSTSPVSASAFASTPTTPITASSFAIPPPSLTTSTTSTTSTPSQTSPVGSSGVHITINMQSGSSQLPTHISVNVPIENPIVSPAYG